MTRSAIHLIHDEIEKRINALISMDNYNNPFIVNKLSKMVEERIEDLGFPNQSITESLIEVQLEDILVEFLNIPVQTEQPKYDSKAENVLHDYVCDCRRKGINIRWTHGLKDDDLYVVEDLEKNTIIAQDYDAIKLTDKLKDIIIL